MDRRLYFLFPSEDHVRCAIDELNSAGIDDTHLLVIAHEDLLRGNQTPITQLHRLDKGWYLEKIIWPTNLLIFFLAAIGLIMSMLWEVYLWSIIAVLIMFATAISGFWFSLKVPNVHFEDFHDALVHDEILLMVVVPKNRVSEIEDLIHHRHPEANVGGVGWSIEALGIQ